MLQNTLDSLKNELKNGDETKSLQTFEKCFITHNEQKLTKTLDTMKKELETSFLKIFHR
eukprot:UN00529